MMYSYEEIASEIETSYSKEQEEKIVFLKKECKEILEADIEEALERMRKLREEFKKTQPVERWLRLLIFQVLFRYLSDEKATLNQKELLSRIHLSGDIFTKHWHMYSPDFKVKQSKFIPMDTGFATDEVEANPVYVAMIHHMIMYADIPTDTFLDFFGKMGIVPAFCANGYAYRRMLTGNDSLKVFQEGLKKPVKVYKKIEKFQREIRSKDTEKERKEKARELADLHEAYVFYEQYHKAMEAYELTASMYLSAYFRPNYWEDKWWMETEEDMGDEGIRINPERKKLESFLKLEKEEFQKLSQVYKKLEIPGKDNNAYLQENALQELFQQSYLLYIDVPKYVREQERFDFPTELYFYLTALLQQYQGNWILTWKNYIYRDTFWAKGKGEEKKANEDYDYTKNFFAILEQLQKVQETTKRKLYVYRYRKSSRNEANSTLFITNINFKNIAKEEFEKKYHLTLSDGFTKMEFDTYCKNTKHWIWSRYKEKHNN